jgi:hypothetical protein
MIALSDQLTVPQVFFNEEHVGGASDLLARLKTWDDSFSKATTTTTATVLDKYLSEVESKSDPTDPRLALPVTSPSDGTDPKAATKIPLSSDNQCVFGCFLLPNGRGASVRELTVNLMTILPKYKLSSHGTYYMDCFPGMEGVDVLMKHYPELQTRDAAVVFGLALQQYGILHHVVCDTMYPFSDTNSYFRLQPYHEPHILNSFQKSILFKNNSNNNNNIKGAPSTELNAMTLVNHLKSILNSIVTRNTTSHGMDYAVARTDPSFLDLEEASCAVQCVDMSVMDDATKLAFGINLYNVMIKHAFIKVGIPETGSQRSEFYDGVCYNVGGHTLSFNALEHGVLRANTRHPYQLMAPFGASDKRKALAVSTIDPRIHFALNCGAKSCPPVSRYTPEAIMEELRIAAMSFCEDDSNVCIHEDTMELDLSMLLKWYRSDFCSSASMLPERVLTFLRGKKKDTLQRMVDSKGTIKIKYLTYDWGTNASDSLVFQSNVLSNSQKSLVGSLLNPFARKEQPLSIHYQSQQKKATEWVTESLQLESAGSV